MNQKYFSTKIIEWYELHKRHLPWRDTSDAYMIWLSEIILQQTRVSQGLPYYLKFINQYPTIFDLAAAPEQEVLRLWQGLGYYSRARNLHRCSKTVVEKYKGFFPNTYKELLTLSGIGSYTAAAIASFAFAEVVPVVDGNVFRVLARHFGMETDISSASAKEIFMAKANELIPHHNPANFNQAIMEFGALHCLPQNPKCEACVLKKSCVAFAEGNQSLYPVKTKKIKIRKRYFYYFVIEQNKKLLMQKREGKDIWQGLFDFYLIETKRSTLLDKIIKEDVFLNRFSVGDSSSIYKHVLSHQVLFARFISVEAKSIDKNLLKSDQQKFYSRKQIMELPKPVLVTKYLSDINFL